MPSQVEANLDQHRSRVYAGLFIALYQPVGLFSVRLRSNDRRRGHFVEIRPGSLMISLPTALQAK